MSRFDGETGTSQTGKPGLGGPGAVPGKDAQGAGWAAVLRLWWEGCSCGDGTGLRPAVGGLACLT